MAPIQGESLTVVCVEGPPRLNRAALVARRDDLEVH